LRRGERHISRTGMCKDQVGTVDDMCEGVFTCLPPPSSNHFVIYILRRFNYIVVKLAMVYPPYANQVSVIINVPTHLNCFVLARRAPVVTFTNSPSVFNAPTSSSSIKGGQGRIDGQLRGLQTDISTGVAQEQRSGTSDSTSTTCPAKLISVPAAAGAGRASRGD
jgi:hypothetical protein